MITITPDMYSWVILPLMIFLARVCDVSLGTIRIISLSRDEKLFAPLLGFVEVLIWLLAVSNIMTHLGNVIAYVAYAGGFAMGNYVGLFIEKKLAIGTIFIRIITKKDATDLINDLRSKGYGVTSVEARGNEGKVHIIYTAVKRSDHDDVIKMVSSFNPKAFYSIEDLKFVRQAIFPNKVPHRRIEALRHFGQNIRQGK